ncbi:FAD dependent oxidoreductase [Roseimicrobium gellanilyticum]|uniref:FAD dependent oxidoreductase n=1 Tax=Roseimicrobium gellanilyticum TaxID=748857 RepID=A0A366HDI8_9BACT|nr:FAD-dependent oxidoreductase [Roseimicrobium gellanilyticum]RBP40476.1 FAD dependent oxidoreductase [Roseimicrobium gellanilyticum]
MNRLLLSLATAASCIGAASLAPAADVPATPNPGLRYYYPVPAANPAQTIQVDVCVYGGTPGGVAAATQAHRMGKKAAFAVFRRHVGGMTSGGLTAVDVGNARSIGGMGAEFLKSASTAKREAMNDVSGELGFRPSQAETIFRKMLSDANVPVYYEHRLKTVEKDGTRITALVFENGNRIEAKMFIDATYEGDLFARAGVKYFVGREDNSAYGETVNGFQLARTHQFRFAVDPYVKAGDPSSGLLPGITGGPLPAPGTGDKLVQAYNFRMWAVKAADGIAWPKPQGYNRGDFALLERYLTTDLNAEWKFTYGSGPVKLNIGDCNNAGPISTDFVGASNDWPDADYEAREKIFQQHVTYQQGMMWFLAHDEKLPEKVREFTKSFGLPKGEFAETNGWPHELYVREGRRMVSDYVMTQKNCDSREVVPDSVGLASYTMDSHHTSRVLVDGKVKAEGCIEIKVPHPYPVSYRSIVPRESECSNLLVSVCLSSTHVAYGSIRMEPVFMILGQSAATAAVQAIDAGVTVQKVDYTKLRERLVADHQVLEWTKEMQEAAEKNKKKK